jgi:hypothetical protein
LKYGLVSNKMKIVYFNLLVIGILTSLNCFAYEYFVEPRISASQRYDTNILLRPNPRRANWVSTLSPGIDFGFRGESSELNSNFTWNHLFYNNQSELDIDEQLLNTKFVHYAEKIKWNLNAEYNSRSSLNTEPSQSGLVDVQLKRRDINISPSLSYSIDDTNSLLLTYDYSDIKFTKRPNINTSDYTNHSVSATLSHLYTPKDRFSLIFSSSFFDSPGNVINIRSDPVSSPDNSALRIVQTIKSDQSTVNHTLQLGWEHTFTEQFLASITAGIRYTETEQPNTSTGQDIFVDDNQIIRGFAPFVSKTTTKTSGFGQVFNALLQKSFERGSVTLNVYQQLNPTAQGNQQQTFLGINGSYALTERWRTGINGSYNIYEQPTQQDSSVDRTYYSIAPSISWRWIPEVNFQLSYTYRQLAFDNQPQVREGNIAQIQFTYQPQINRQVK